MPGIFSKVASIASGIKSYFSPGSKALPVAQPPTVVTGPAMSFWSKLKKFVPRFTRTPPLLEQIRAATVSGYLNLLPWYDQYTEETAEMRQMYRIMMRDPTIKAGLFDKVFSVAAMDLQLAPASESPRDKLIADFVSDALVKFVDGGIRKIVESLCFPALIDGHSISEPVWGVQDRGQWKGKWIYRALKSKDTEHLQLMGDEFRNVVAIRANTYNGGRLFDPQDFILFTVFSLFESPAGMSDLRAAYRAFFIMQTAWELRAIGLEKFSLPLLRGVYKNDKDKTPLEQTLQSVRSQNYVVAPDGVLIEAIDLARRGTADFESAIRDLREEILLSIVGAYLQAITSDGGSNQRGNSQIHKGTTEIIKWHLSRCVADVLNRRDGGLIPRLVDRNFLDAEYPFATMGGLNDTDLAASLTIDEGLYGMGIPLSIKDFYQRYGRQRPVDPADVLRASPQQIMQPGQQPFSQPGQPQQQPQRQSPGGGLFAEPFRRRA